MERTIHTDENVLSFAIHDAINMFVREVLVGKGIVEKSTINARQHDIDEGLRLIIAQCIADWKISTVNEEA